MKTLFAALVMMALASVAFALSGATPVEARVLVYKSDACAHCGPYLTELMAGMSGAGIAPSDIQVMDFLNDPARRQEMAQWQQRFGVPMDLQGHMMAIIDGKIVLEGHVPMAAVRDALQKPLPSEPVVYYQDSMDAGATQYVMMQGGTRATYSVASGQPVQVGQNEGEAVGKYGFAALVFLALAGITALAWKR